MIPALLTIAQFSAPVAFAATGETIGQRSGVINVGLEGTMLTAAYAATQIAILTGSVWAGLAVGILVGVVTSLLQAIFTVLWSLDQVVCGTAINLVGLGLTGTLFAVGTKSGVAFSGAPALPRIFDSIDPVLLCLPLTVGLVSFALSRTGWGLLTRATGERPEAVRAAGYDPVRLRLAAQCLAGAFAGLAGTYLALGIASSFNENMTVGRGFIAIAMVTFGKFKPWGACLASLLIGSLEWLQVALQGSSAVPVQVFTALPYVAALAVLVVAGKGTSVPESLGVAYAGEGTR